MYFVVLAFPSLFALSSSSNVACPDGATCSSAVDSEASENLHLLQVGLAMQLATGEIQPKKTENASNLTHTHTHTKAHELTHERVWFACKTHPPEAQTRDAQEAGLKPMEMMQCTRQMKATELCCANWENMSWPLSLGNTPDSPEVDDNGVAHLQVDRSQEIVKVCTQKESASELMEEAHMSGGGMIPGECFTTDFTEDEVTGKDPTMPLRPGELILQERILWFLRQGLAVEDVPTCAKIVASCPNGEPPLTVSSEFLEEAGQVLLEDKAEKVAENDFTEEGSRVEKLRQLEISAGDRGAKKTKKSHRRIGRRGANADTGGGSLMTSGSFTMMASTGNQ